MSFWGGKTIINVAVSATKLIDNNPDIIGKAVIEAVLDNRNISDALMATNLTGFHNKVDSYFQEGRTNFKNGLPDILYANDGVDFTAITEVLTSLEGETVYVQSSSFGSPMADFLAKAILSEEPYNYHPQTHQVRETKLNGSDYVIYTSAEFVYGILRIHFTWGSNQTAYMDFSVPNVPTGVFPLAPCYMVRYLTQWQLDRGHGEDSAKFFYYFPSYSDEYPSLEVSEGVTEKEQFLPIAPVVINKKKVIDMVTYKQQLDSEEVTFVEEEIPTELNQTTQNLLDQIGVSLADVTDAIYDEDNADSDKVDDAFVVFAVDMATEEEASIRYMYHFFEDLRVNASVNEAKFKAWLMSPLSVKSMPPSNIIGIRDEEFNTHLDFSYIKSTTEVGTLTVPTKELVILPPMSQMVEYGGHLTEASYLKIRVQTGDNEITELQVHGLRHISGVYKDKAVVRTLGEVADEEYDGGFYLPVSYSIVANLSGSEEAALYYDSLTLVIYVVDKQHLSWYQNAGFLSLLKFVLIAVAIVFQLYGLEEAIAATLAKTLTNLVYNFALTYITAEALQALARLVGSELALLIAAITAVVALSSPEGTKFFGDLLNADELMKSATQMIDAVSAITEDAFLDLQKDIEEFDELVESKQEQLEEMNDMLYSDNLIDGYTILNRGNPIDVYETPTEFYYRTTHNTNAGVLSLDTVSAYVEGALQLPRDI